jgi:hypothetical protein
MSLFTWLNHKPMACLTALLVANCSTCAQTGAATGPADPWSAVPEILRRIVPPKFPAGILMS